MLIDKEEFVMLVIDGKTHQKEIPGTAGNTRQQNVWLVEKQSKGQSVFLEHSGQGEIGLS